jgi:carboxypeptidase Taq
VRASESPTPAERRLYELWSEYCDLEAAEALLEWDQETCLPSRAHDTRGEVLATVAALKHRCLISCELRDALAACAVQAEAGSVLAAQVRVARREVERAVKVPERLKREIAAARSAGLAAWQAARQARDFSLFERPLARMLALRRDEGAAIAGGGDPYDALLDRYEPGSCSAGLEPLFRRLVDILAPLVEAVAASGVTVDESIARGHFPGEGQVELGRRAAAAVGYDFEAGRLDASAHPFCVRVHRRDVRMTYRFQEDDFRPCLFGILHETGHALYEQGLPEAWHRTPVDDAASLGIHESQSLLWENHVGRSRGFWRWLVPHFRETFPAAATFDADELWPALHTVQPSLIRVDADETTYNLHVAVRFELELALFHGELDVRDLPRAWSERYQRYLGIGPTHDAEGVLQDIHWAQGSFGYFPTYTLGMLAAAQLAAAARRDLGGLDAAFADGDFGPLLGWLRERLHGQGRLHPAGELIARATGRPLDVADFVAYLRRNAEAVYAVAPPCGPTP